MTEKGYCFPEKHCLDKKLFFWILKFIKARLFQKLLNASSEKVKDPKGMYIVTLDIFMVAKKRKIKKCYWNGQQRKLGTVALSNHKTLFEAPKEPLNRLQAVTQMFVSKASCL